MYILIGGLGDSVLSLVPWKTHLVYQGHRVLYLNATPKTGKATFMDRVKILYDAVEASTEPVHIIGQSAGGLATLIVANKLPHKVRGVIAVSPAMPRGISPLGLPLLRIMWRYQIAMWRNKLINVETSDYTELALNGVVKDRKFFPDFRKPISGREATELSTPWLQPKLGNIKVPVVYVYGNQDQWVSPRAHAEFARKLTQSNPTKTHVIVAKDMGHLPVHGHDRYFIMQKALDALAEMENTPS